MAALRGLRVVAPITPGREGLVDALERAGAVALPVQFIAIEPATDPLGLIVAATEWCDGEYEWIAVTSRNAVTALAAAAHEHGRMLDEPLPFAQVAAVGEATRAVCDELGLTVSLVPSAVASAQGLVADFPAGSGRVLVPCGNLASPVLERGLARKGWEVTTAEAYRTVEVTSAEAALERAFASGEVDAVFLTSGSMARSLAASYPSIPASTMMIAIGTTTAAAATAAGLTVTAVADQPTYGALVAALAEHLQKGRG